MKTSKLIILISFLLVIMTTGYSCKKNPSTPTPDTDTATVRVYSQTVQRRTPTSPRAASLNGVSDTQLMWIDEEMTNLIEDFRAEGSSYVFDPSTAIIYFKHDCTLSPASQTLSFRVRGDNYDGGTYDVDPRPGIGYVYAAEYVITEPANNEYGYVLMDEWVVCSALSDEPYSRDTIRFGKEHVELFRNNPARYQATATHTSENGHPLILRRNTLLFEWKQPADIFASKGNAEGRLK